MIKKWKLCIMFQRFQCVIPKCAKIRLMLAEPALHLNTSEVNERAFLHLQFPYSSHHIHPVGQSILLLSHKSWCNKDQTRVGTLDGITIRTFQLKYAIREWPLFFEEGEGGIFPKPNSRTAKTAGKKYARGAIGKNLLFRSYSWIQKKLLHKLLPRGKKSCTTRRWEKCLNTPPVLLPLRLHCLNFLQTKLY